MCKVLWCCLRNVYSIKVLFEYCIHYHGVFWVVYIIMVLFEYCVQYYGAVWVLCTVLFCSLRTMCNIMVLIAYPVEYGVTVCILCTFLWYCFHTMCSNIVVLAYSVHCGAVSSLFTFPTPNSLTNARLFHISFTFHYRITQRTPQGRYIVGIRNHTSNVTVTNSWHPDGSQSGPDWGASRRLRSCCSVEGVGNLRGCVCVCVIICVDWHCVMVSTGLVTSLWGPVTRCKYSSSVLWRFCCAHCALQGAMLLSSPDGLRLYMNVRVFFLY